VKNNNKLRNALKNRNSLSNKTNWKRYFKNVAGSMILFSIVFLALFYTSKIGSIVSTVALIILIILSAWVENKVDSQVDSTAVRKLKKVILFNVFENNK